MPVEASRATELFRLAASDAQQSFEVNCWCYARAMRIAGLLLLNGAPPQDLGWSVICSPPAWLHERGRRPVMTAPAVDGYSLKILLGGRNETIFEDYLFRRIATTGGGDVAIYKRDGAALTRPGNIEPLSYRFADFNCESWCGQPHRADFASFERTRTGQRRRSSSIRRSASLCFLLANGARDEIPLMSLA